MGFEIQIEVQNENQFCHVLNPPNEILFELGYKNISIKLLVYV